MLRRSRLLSGLWPKKRSLRCKGSSGVASQSVTDIKANEQQQQEVVGKGTQKKLPARLPLAKNFFVGLADRELLAFPEVVSREDMTKLQNELLPLQNYFSRELVQSLNKRGEGKHPPPSTPDVKDIETDLRQLHLYGLNVSADYEGGKGWGYSASLMASEPECRVPMLGMGLAVHRGIIDVLQELGTQEQRDYFLPLLANGTLVASEAIYESSCPEHDLFHTKATYDGAGKEWLLNGSKSFVITSPKPSGGRHLFLVLAQTQQLSVNLETGQMTTLFMVDSKEPGVKLSPPHETVGCNQAQISTVHFKDVILNERSVLGDLNRCNDVTDCLQTSTRLRSSMVALGLSKEILNDLIEYTTNQMQYGALLKDMKSIQAHLASATASVYGMESMIYLTAGLLDEFESPDVSLEAAITKYFCLKEMLSVGVKSLEIYGCRSSLMKESCTQRYQDALQLYTNTESIDILTLSIAFMGLQHAGTLLGNDIRKQRNPLFHPGYIVKKLFEKSNIDHPNTKMRLSENVHPSLEMAAFNVEHSVARLRMCTELMLSRCGADLVQEHTVTRRLADMVSLIYYMYASLSRASRSYCIGLPLAESELLMALTICMGSNERVKNLATEIFNGQYANNDNYLFGVADQIFKHKGYFPAHPLTYNF